MPCFEQEGVKFQHIKVVPGQRVFTAAQPFDSLYVVHSGFLKTMLVDELGNEQIVGFPMKGDILGVDGIHRKTYQSEAVAMTSSELVVIPFKTLVEVGKRMPEFELEVLTVMSRELARQRRQFVALCSLSAEARVARFLSTLSDRYAALGYSSTEFTLRMTRQEIGRYLGLALVTVSRIMQALQHAGLISVDQKAISIHRPEVLRTMRRLPPKTGFAHE